MVITACLNCGKEENEDGSKLSQCSKCKVAKYCTRQCQSDHWKKHKKWCKLTEGIPIDSTVVVGDPIHGNDFIDMNRVFDYAGSYLDELRQMHITIPEAAIVTYRSGSFVTLKFEPPYLFQFLAKRNLYSFGLHFCRRYPHLVRAMTNAGRALIPLSTHETLHTLSLGNLHFDDVSDFGRVLSGHRSSNQTLKYLCIGDLSVGIDDDYFGIGSLSIWTLEDAISIAKVIRDIDSLEHLSLTEMEDECLAGRDQDVLAVLLSNKPNLRMFQISGLEPWELKLFGRSCQGSVTDESIQIIVDKVGSSLQELKLVNQKQVTVAGLEEMILRRCPLLRSLTIVGLEISVQDLARLLSLSDTLLYFGFGKGPPYESDEKLEQWIPAVLATEGRTILSPGRGTVPVEDGKVPQVCVENADRSQELIDKSRALFTDAEAEATNMWEFLL